MREHEVPTHVQAEDKALLWFTFPQIVAVVATCAVAYGVYRYFPFGPSGLKLGNRHPAGRPGHRHDRGQGGRDGGCPWWPPTCLKFNLGARRYAGSPADLAVSEPPPQPEAKPDPPAAAGEEGRIRRGPGGEGGPAPGAAPLPSPQLVRQGTAAARTLATSSSSPQESQAPQALGPLSWR